jgi:hypothetical protein
VPHVLVEVTEHHVNQIAVVLGKSSQARKGTAGDHARRVMRSVDADWTDRRIMSGLSSGEGLMYAARDPVFEERAGEDAEFQEACAGKGAAEEPTGRPST